MINKKLSDVMFELGVVNAFLDILTDYCEFNMNSEEMGHVYQLLRCICAKSKKIYNRLDRIDMQIFDFEINNLK